MEAPHNKKRSRSGCTECRRRHRKCDEVKPTCSGCRHSGKQCTYVVRLQWGGRPFHKSRFGACLRGDPSLVQVPVSTGVERPAFVYGSVPAYQNGPTSSVQDSQWNSASLIKPINPATLGPRNHGDSKTRRQNTQPDLGPIFRNPDELQWLQKPYRLLLHHFTSYTMLSLSCHPIIQRDFCSVLVPMGLQTSHLLAALLSLAATHRLSLGLEQSETQLFYLEATSMSQLQTVLGQQSPDLNDSVVATTLTLCLSDIIGLGRRPGSWRLHLQGAAAIIAEHLKQTRRSPDSLPFSTALLWRWYLSIETTSLLCGNLVVSPGSRTVLEMRHILSNNEIDDFSGFSTALVPVFGDISLLAVESGAEQGSEQARLSKSQSSSNDPSIFIKERCNRIIQNVSSMLESRRGAGRFRPDIDVSLSSLHRSDFVTLDQTFHHVALLQLYRRVLDLPSSSPFVQNSVKEIIRSISTMHFLHEPCPGVAVLQPLFTAGCEAWEACDRDNVRSLLSRVSTYYGMGNVRSARAFLEELWSLRDANGDVEGRVRWDKVMVEKGLDIVTY